MDSQALLVWSMALGAILAIALARATDFALRPGASAARGVAYHLGVFLLVLTLSGVLAEVAQPAPRALRTAQVLAGPLVIALSNLWIHGWLAAHQRDRLMAGALRASALALPLAALACLALPPEQQLPMAAATTLLGGTLTLWLTVRAALMGDRLAPIMAGGCLLTLPALAGMYVLAMGPAEVGLAAQGGIALCAVLSNAATGFVLWRRDRHARRVLHAATRPSQYDPVTRLHTGAALVRRLIHAQRRRRRTRREGAVLAVLLFDLERVAQQVGAAGVNELLIVIAGRIQRQVGVVNPVGRYWDRCFVSLVETLHSPGWLRTLGLRVATSLRRPVEVTGRDGERVVLRADIGVGVVHLGPRHVPVEDLLHDAQQVAQAARQLRSRAGFLEPGSGAVVPLEEADLGPRRHRHAALATPAGAAGPRPARG